MSGHRMLACVLVVGLALTLGGCANLVGPGAFGPGPRPLQETGAAIEEGAPPAEGAAPAARPNFVVRYLEQRAADLFDIFNVEFAFAAPLEIYGFDATASMGIFEAGLGYMKAKNAYQIGLEGRGTYAAPYERDMWRFLFWSEDREVVDIANGIGNGYANPEGFAGTADYPFYKQWADALTTKAGWVIESHGEIIPAKRIIPNSNVDGPYSPAKNGWQQHIGRVGVEVAIPFDPILLKIGTKIGLSFNICQVTDFVLGIVCIDYPYGDDLYRAGVGRPGFDD